VKRVQNQSGITGKDPNDILIECSLDLGARAHWVYRGFPIATHVFMCVLHVLDPEQKNTPLKDQVDECKTKIWFRFCIQKNKKLVREQVHVLEGIP